MEDLFLDFDESEFEGDDSLDSSKIRFCMPSVGPAFKDATTNSNTWKTPLTIIFTNCYAYAINCPDAGAPSPGALYPYWVKEYKEEDITLALVKKYLRWDRLIEITREEAQQDTESHIIAVRVREGFDYHFLRRDDINKWSHKFSGLVRDTDENNQPVIDPETAAFPHYPEFVGYYKIPSDGLAYVAE